MTEGMMKNTARQEQSTHALDLPPPPLQLLRADCITD